MTLTNFPFKPLVAALMAASLLSACGGGGGSEDTLAPVLPETGVPTDPSAPPVAPTPVDGSVAMTMSCVDGSTYQCSGDTVIRSDNGVALTRSGVQVYGRSTSDLAATNTSPTTATGLALTSGGAAEVRLSKDATGIVSTPALLLRNLGLSWDGRTERPLIIETFRTTQGRVQLAANGAITAGALPASSDVSFYDFATRGAGATQANYANNVYFPRTGNPSRCDATVTSCPTTETAGVQRATGDWRTGGGVPDWVGASRLHEDGDIHAGDGVPGAVGTGVPFPGSKGYRSFDNWSLQYANLSAWTSQDTVQMAEWTGGAGTAEHNKNRRGLIAFGAVTDPAVVPTTGNASYSGIVYGWYAPNAAANPSVFRGDATVTVNFATRQVAVSFRNTVTYDAAGTPVPLALEANTLMGAAGTNVAGYMTGTAASSGLTGGISGRYFGPVVAAGSGNAGPAEVGGALSLSNATSGAAVVGGFIARKR